MARNFFRQINPICESNKTPLDKIQQLLKEGRVKIEKSKPETTYLEIKYVGYNERFEIEFDDYELIDFSTTIFNL